jgi:hypothetical protein
MIFGALTAALAVGSMAVLIAMRLVKRARIRRPTAVYFPSVSVESRFGGGFGGGAIAEVQFGKPADRG